MSSYRQPTGAVYFTYTSAAEVRIVAELPTQTACSWQASSSTPWTLEVDWQKLCYAITI